MENSIDKLLKKINFIDILDKKLIKQAFVHTSYTNEHDKSHLESNERLEFLGDAVLKLCCSDFLYKKFPNQPEGDLSKIRAILVSDATLMIFASELNFEILIKLSFSEKKQKGQFRQSTLACAFEAFIGALYLQTTLQNIQKFIIPFWEKQLPSILNNMDKINAKATLQEYTQSKNKKLPIYEIVNEYGLDHEKTFEVAVSYNDKMIAKGVGTSKKEAEQNAAYQACLKLGVIKDE